MKCPFCGVEADVPHESQEGCIEALNAEIGRMRTLLDTVRSAELLHPIDIEESDEEPEESGF